MEYNKTCIYNEPGQVKGYPQTPDIREQRPCTEKIYKYTYRKIVPVVRLGWLAPARQLHKNHIHTGFESYSCNVNQEDIDFCRQYTSPKPPIVPPEFIHFVNIIRTENGWLHPTDCQEALELYLHLISELDLDRKIHLKKPSGSFILFSDSEIQTQGGNEAISRKMEYSTHHSHIPISSCIYYIVYYKTLHLSYIYCHSDHKQALQMHLV